MRINNIKKLSDLELHGVQQVISQLTLMNNKFMNVVFESNLPAAELLLRIILKDDKIKVIAVETQSFIQNLYGHSAQMDILAQSADGSYFNVEVQRSNEGASRRRARFYSSILDDYLLDSGEDYDELPDTCVIFITEGDVLRYGLPQYSISRTIEENGASFGDGSRIVYVNASCQDDTPLGRLMSDFSCPDPAKMHYRALAERVESLKTQKESEGKMVDIIEEFAEKVGRRMAKEAAAEAAKEAFKEMQVERLEGAKNMLADGLALDKVAKYSRLSLEEVQKLASEMSA